MSVLPVCYKDSVSGGLICTEVIGCLCYEGNRDLKQRQRDANELHLKILPHFIFDTSRLLQLIQLVQKRRTIQEPNWLA